jgi:hypothetical protein
MEFGCAQRGLDAGLLLQLICSGCNGQSNLLHRSSKTRQAMKKFNGVDYIIRLAMRSGNMKLDRRRIRSQGRSGVLNELALEAPATFPEQRGERLNALRLNVSPSDVEDHSDLATAPVFSALRAEDGPRHFQHHKSCRGKLKPEVCSFW